MLKKYLLFSFVLFFGVHSSVLSMDDDDNTHADNSNQNLQVFPRDLVTKQQFRGLTYLDVSHNQIQTIPPEIGNLHNLQVLNVSHNNIQVIPDEVDALADNHSLKKLYAAENPLRCKRNASYAQKMRQELGIDHELLKPKELSKLFLKKQLRESTTPIVMVWDPALGDAAWGAKVVINYGLEKARAGHSILVWIDCNGNIRSASFFPNNTEVFRRIQELVNCGISQNQAIRQAKQEIPGVFKSFDKDVDLYSRLQNRIQRNLTWDDNKISYMGVEVEGWDIAKLTATFNRLKRNPPVFDLKSRGVAKSCSTVVLDLIDSSIKIDKYKEVKECADIYFAHDLLTNQRVLLAAAVVPIYLPISFVSGRLNSLGFDISRKLRTGSSINPNFVKKVFTSSRRSNTEFEKQVNRTRFEKRFD